MRIELVSRVKHSTITTVGLFLKRPFVDVLSSCLSFAFFCNISFWKFLFVLSEKNGVNFFLPATCELVTRVDLQSSLSRDFDCPLNRVFNPAQPHLRLPDV